jgi:glycosyltransferase involved in cell wall biosynthesis
MNESKPLVSIGMPIYNGAKFLRPALDSLLAQKFSEFELLISDNASADDTAVICNEFAVRDSRIKYFRQTSTIPALENFNFVLRQATGEFFMWAACDDVWEPGFVGALTKLLQGNATAVLAFPAFDNVAENGRAFRQFPKLAELGTPKLFSRLWSYMMQKEKHGKANPIYGLMRRRAILEAGGFKLWGEGPWGSDFLFVFRMLSLGQMVLSPELLFHKRECSRPAVEPSMVKRRRADIAAALDEKCGYLKGYANVLAQVKGLTFLQRVLLRLGLSFRYAYHYWRAWTQWLLHSLKSVFLK